MIIRELINELKKYPLDWEVFVEVDRKQKFATDVVMESGGVSTWVVITDYPIESKKV